MPITVTKHMNPHARWCAANKIPMGSHSKLPAVAKVDVGICRRAIAQHVSRLPERARPAAAAARMLLLSRVESDWTNKGAPAARKLSHA